MFVIKSKRKAKAVIGRVVIGLGLGLALVAPTVGLAQSQPRDGRSREAARLDEPTPAEALANTRKTGVPTLVLVTSESSPASMALWRDLKAAHDESTRRDAIQLIHVAIEELGNTAKKLGLKRVPAVLLYCRDDDKVNLAGQHSGPMDVEFIGGWVGLYHRDGTKTKVAVDKGDDADVRQTNYQDYPSAQSTPQYQQPQPPPKAPPYQAPPPPQPPQQPTYYPPQQQQYYTPPPMVPVYQQPQPTMVYAPSPPPIYVQPSAPTIVMGPAPQPNFAFAPQPASAPMAMAPMNLLAPANAPQPPQGNAPQPPANAPQPPTYAMAPAPQPTYAMAPAPQPTYAMAPAPPPTYAMAPAPQPTYAMAPAPQPVYAAAPQPAYAPASVVAAAPALMLSNPRLFGRLLGTIGESLSELGNPRVRMARAPAYQSAIQADPVYPATPVYPVKRARGRLQYQELEEEPEYDDAPPPPPPVYRAPRPSPQSGGDGHSLRNLFRKHSSE